MSHPSDALHHLARAIDNVADALPRDDDPLRTLRAFERIAGPPDGSTIEEAFAKWNRRFESNKPPTIGSHESATDVLLSSRESDPLHEEGQGILEVEPARSRDGGSHVDVP